METEAGELKNTVCDVADGADVRGGLEDTANMERKSLAELPPPPPPDEELAPVAGGGLGLDINDEGKRGGEGAGKT